VHLEPGLEEVTNAQADGKSFALLPNVKLFVGETRWWKQIIAVDDRLQELGRRGEKAECKEEDCCKRRIHYRRVRRHLFNECR